MLFDIFVFKGSKLTRVEVMNANGYTQDDPKSRPRPMTPEEKERYQQKLMSSVDESTGIENKENNGTVS